MLIFIKSLYHTCFPARQLLIRQNGEVKHIKMAPWFQFSVSLLILVALVWLSISSYRVYTQKNQISDIQHNQRSEQTLWQKKTAEQKAIYAQQLKQLSILEEKQNLLQMMIESLPASINKNNLNSDETIESPIKEKKGNLHEPLIDDVSNDKQAKLNKELSFHNRFEQLNQSYKYSFALLDYQITQREHKILAMLKETGLQPALEKHLSTSEQTTAQGGPLDLFDEVQVPEPFLSIADKLIALNDLEDFLHELPSSIPIAKAKYYISSNFGLRKDPMNKRRALHKGIDLGGSYNTEIFAPADAVVLRARRNGGYGNFVELKHKNGLITRFGHLNKINVKKGQIVSKKDIIGLMGSTGRSTGTHLHYEVLLNGKQINPIKITKALSRVQ